jgi:hypothetical protein
LAFVPLLDEEVRIVGIFGKGPHGRDKDDRDLNKHAKPTKKLCKQKYQVTVKGKTVTRTCIKPQGHGGNHA